MPTLTKHFVTDEQKAKWKHLGYPMHFSGRACCTFRLATLIERKIIVSTIGEWRPKMFDGDITMEGLGGAIRPEDEQFYETFVFTVGGFKEDGVPMLGNQLDGERCQTADEAYALHKRMCKQYQKELNMGMHK